MEFLMRRFCAVASAVTVLGVAGCGGTDHQDAQEVLQRPAVRQEAEKSVQTPCTQSSFAERAGCEAAHRYLEQELAR
jgi:hypothetical protein